MRLIANVETYQCLNIGKRSQIPRETALVLLKMKGDVAVSIIEAGHYYSAKGPTIWSRVGWGIMLNMRAPGDKSMLFVDDIHSLEDVSAAEVGLPNIEFKPNPDITVLESTVVAEAWEFLDLLRELTKRRRARKNSGVWYCSGIPLTTRSGQPSCVLLDAGLTILKRKLGFQEGINILPKFYEDQQKKVLRLVAKTLPDFHLRAILYDLEGKSWEIQDER